MTTYAEKLRDPRWEKKRTKILIRDSRKCKICDNWDVPMNVHHSYYIWNNEPWDYPDKSLITLCKYCHEYLQELTRDKKNYKNYLINHVLEFGLTKFAEECFKEPVTYCVTIMRTSPSGDPYETWLNFENMEKLHQQYMKKKGYSIKDALDNHTND